MLAPTALLLGIAAIPAEAAILDDIKATVNSINSRISTLLSRTATLLTNTNGMQEVVSTVQDTRVELRASVVDELRDGMEEAQDLAEFLKARNDSAGNLAQYPSLVDLVRNLDAIATVLIDNPNKIQPLNTLADLLAFLPEKTLAPFARLVSQAGIDQVFINRLGQMAVDLVEVREAAKEIDAQEQNAATLKVQSNLIAAANAPALLIQPITRCVITDSDRQIRLSRLAKTIKGIGFTLKYFGTLTEALSENVKTGKALAVWGWVGINLETKVAGATGKIMALTGDGVIAIADKVLGNMNACDDQARFDAIMASHQEILDSNNALMTEICGLTRYRSAECQALLP